MSELPESVEKALRAYVSEHPCAREAELRAAILAAIEEAACKPCTIPPLPDCDYREPDVRREEGGSK